MNTQRNVSVKPLGDGDARNLFGTIVGDLKDKCDIAAEIIEKCAGLPLAITTIANALKGKSDSVRRDALRQLENSNPRCVPEMDNTLYSTIELSYALLNSEEAKSLLLLCALSDAGSDIYFIYLLAYGMGLGLFQDVYTINDRKNRIKSLIDYLEASCLLLKGNHNETVKMHDITHVVVASIAKEKRMFNIQDADGFKEVLVKGIPRTLRLKFNRSLHLRYGVEILVKKAKDLYLDQLDGVKDILWELDGDGFPQLKRLSVKNSSEVLYIVNSMGCNPSNDAFPILESLLLINLSIMEKICCGLVDAKSFSKLRILKVEKCDRVRYLFSSSMASNISQIQEIEVTDCKELKEIFGQESAKRVDENERNCKIEFKQLHSLVLQCLPQFTSFGLKLEGLPKLTRFGTGNSIEFPTLNELHIGSCSNLKTFFHKSFGPDMLRKEPEEVSLEKHITDINPLFNEKVAFPSLEKMMLFHLDNLQLIWHSQLYGDSFSKLKKVRVEFCEKLRTTVPSNSTQGLLTFHNLETLIIENCWNMKSLFPVSIATGLLQLKELWISFCGLEEIVAKEEVDGTPTFLFPQLTFLKLQNLAELRHFYLGLHTIEWPMLKCLVVYDCGKTKLYALDGESQPAMFSFEKVTPNLETLGLNGDYVTSSLRHIFTPSIILGLAQLKEIRVINCALIEEIISKEEEKEAYIEKIMITQLNFIILDSLPNLRSFYSGMNTLECPALKAIIVAKCPQIETFVFADIKHQSDHIVPLFSEKVAFPSLEKMMLLHLDNLQLIWHNQLHKDSFSNLKEVGFSNLERLKLSEFPTLKERFWSAEVPASLFYSLKLLVLDMCLDTLTAIPFNVLCNLKNLEKLEIRSCDSLKEVFDMEGQLNVDGHKLKKSHQEVLDLNNLKSFEVHNCCSLRHIFTPSIILGLAQLKEIAVINCDLIEEIISKEEEKEADIEKIMITQLNSIVLESLPNLTSFYSGMNTLECPALKAIAVAKCPQIETFVFADIKHQSDHIVPLLSEKVVFPSLEKMFLSHLDNLHLIWHNQLLADSYGKLKEVTIEFCEKLMTIVPANNSQGLLTFHNLETLTVKRCWNMKSLFPVSIATSLLQLKELKVISCGLEEIVAKEEVDGTPTFLFPQLTLLKLENLAKLRHFYLGLHTIEWPMLKRLFMYDCGKTKVYASNGESQPALFSFEKVGFREFGHLKLGEFPTLKENIWNGKVPIDLFYNLKSLVLDGLSDVATIIPSNVLSYFKNVETIEVKGCDSLKKVFDMEEQLDYVDGHTAKCFKNLKSFKVDNCNNLRYIFTASFVSSLVQLEQIEVKSCALVEEIITKIGEKNVVIDKIEIPLLKSINLESLPNLTSFYSGSNILECPPLKTIIIKDCQNIHLKDFSLHLPSLFSENVSLFEFYLQD
ncbi:hypothetical protein Patl1_07018 [Pistacia atlantica]|uniref:Uncharacterized protein n=1 Tax=Pistacia atlantica TaxID=434234 RepID=A0ACC1AI24_9ROSI|nr:hypothetical protein Patl1_07018 [Pistacia atlantica]